MDISEPFAKTEPPLHKEPQIRYLLLPASVGSSTISKPGNRDMGFALAFHLANTLFQTACRFDELIQLSWARLPKGGEEIVALRIKGSVMREDSLLEWCHRGRRRSETPWRYERTSALRHSR
jgi:hypothetical protein